MSETIVQKTKRCSRCKEDKSLADFGNNKSHTDGKQYYCKECKRIVDKGWKDRNPTHSKMWREKNPHYSKERNRRRYEENPNVYIEYDLKRKYNLTIVDVERMKEAQNYKCRICSRVRKLIIDHCHDTGKVRGMLCNPCNTMLGKMGDNKAGIVQWCETATAYLDGELRWHTLNVMKEY